MLHGCSCLALLFFSRRGRHTTYWRDWSSDVCSSDLLHDDVLRMCDAMSFVGGSASSLFDLAMIDQAEGNMGAEIGRASCRERVLTPGVAGSLYKTTILLIHPHSLSIRP